MIEDFIKRRNISSENEQIFEYNKWDKEIPKLKFKEDWDVRIRPNFGGSIIRFQVYKESVSVSVYLDCYDMLGCVGKPYWEIYPYGDDAIRFYLDETEELISEIEHSLNYQLVGNA